MNTHKRLHLMVILGILCALLSSPLNAQAQILTGTISGVIRDVNGNPITGIGVSVHYEPVGGGDVQGDCSDTLTGAYTIYGVPYGSYIVSAGYDCNNQPSNNLAVEYWQNSPNFANVIPVTVSQANSNITGIDFTLQVTDETEVYSPYIFAILESNTIYGDFWPEGSPITLTIDNPANGPGVDYTDTNSTGSFEAIQGFSLAPGMIMMMTNGDITKTHIITPINVEGTNTISETVFGIAYPYSPVWVACGDDRISRYVVADSTGHWEVNFGVPGPTDQELDLCNLGPGEGGFAIEGGGDLQNDFTMDTWEVSLPPPLQRVAPYDFVTELNGLVNCNYANTSGTGEATINSDFSTGNLLLDLRARSLAGQSEGRAGIGIKYIAPINGTIQIDSDVTVAGFDSIALVPLKIKRIGDTGIVSVKSSAEISVVRINPRQDNQNSLNFASRIMTPGLLPIPKNPVDIVSYRPQQTYSVSLEIDVNAGDELYICVGIRSEVVAAGLVPWVSTAKVLYGQTKSNTTKVEVIRISYK